MNDKNEYAQYLIREYGMFLSVGDLARVFKYANNEAVRKAEKAGRLPVTLRKFPQRRGLYVPVLEVAEVVRKLSMDVEEEMSR